MSEYAIILGILIMHIIVIAWVYSCNTAMTRRLDFAETTTNMVAGLVIGFIILMLIGTPAPLAAAAQVSFVVVSFIRTYLIRRLFRWIGERYDRTD